MRTRVASQRVTNPAHQVFRHYTHFSLVQVSAATDVALEPQTIVKLLFRQPLFTAQRDRLCLDKRFQSGLTLCVRVP